MKHYPHAIVKPKHPISYRATFPYIVLGVMIVALFLVYIITSASMTSALFSLEQLRRERSQVVTSHQELVREQSIRNSLEYISEATASFGLEEIHHAAYLELQESGIVVKK